MKPPPRPTVVTPSPASFAPLIEERHLDPSARVYVNRNLRLASIGAIGFDLDHTLAYYDPIPIERLAFRLTQQKLVEKRGYPSRILDIEYDPEFVIRGLVIDRRRGNILKMDYHSYVSKAFHGRQLLLSDDRKRVYRRQRVRLSYDSFVSVDTFFHLPEVYLYVALVDDAEKNGGKKRKIGRAENHKLYADVREMIDEAHADRSIKSEIMARPGEFLRDDLHVAATLDEFRRAGKKLFLLTNSEMYYTDALLTHLFRHGNGHSNWREYFDLIIVQSRKPAFFLNRNGTDIAAQPIVDPGASNGPPTFSGGDAQFLEKMLGFRGDQIVYFGDHTYGDILRSKKNLGWRTAMIVPELDDEIETTLRIDGDLKRLRALALRRETLVYRKTALQRELRARLVTGQRERPADGFTPETETMEKRFMDAESELQKLDAEMAVLEVRCDTAYNPHWGPLFREGNEMSRFAHQVRDFACLYTSRVSNFLNYPMDHYFQSPGSFMPHELR
jgi:HAD superfamily 5'-nucleotidase-like hydrolase